MAGRRTSLKEETRLDSPSRCWRRSAAARAPWRGKRLSGFAAVLAMASGGRAAFGIAERLSEGVAPA